MVVCSGLFISRLVLHFMQYASIVISDSQAGPFWMVQGHAIVLPESEGTVFIATDLMIS